MTQTSESRRRSPTCCGRDASIHRFHAPASCRCMDLASIGLLAFFEPIRFPPGLSELVILHGLAHFFGCSAFARVWTRSGHSHRATSARRATDTGYAACADGSACANRAAGAARAPRPPMTFYVAGARRTHAAAAATAGSRSRGRSIAVPRHASGNSSRKSGVVTCRSISLRPAAIWIRRWRWAPCCVKSRSTARVARTVVNECGFEAQDSDVCLKLKQSGRELHGELWTRGAMCNSACPYLMLGATTREIAPDAVLAVHSPKVVVHFSGLGMPSPGDARRRDRTRARARRPHGRELYRRGWGSTSDCSTWREHVKFEDIHALTREEIIRFGIDRRERWRRRGSSKTSAAARCARSASQQGRQR